MAVIKIAVDTKLGHSQYILDEIADLNSFQHKETMAGDIAYVLENKKFYIMDSNSTWREQ